MQLENLGKFFLQQFIGFLGLTALVAIVTVLSGEFGELHAKILTTTLTISAACVCSMACAAFIGKRKIVLLGISGIAAAVLAAGFLITGIWTEIETKVYWKTTGTIITLALVLAHTLLLSLPELNKPHRWVHISFLGLIGILWAQVLILIWAELETDFFLKSMTVVAILVALNTLIIPILSKVGSAGNISKDKDLVLKLKDKDVYIDNKGNLYSVKPIRTTDSGA